MASALSVQPSPPPLSPLSLAFPLLEGKVRRAQQHTSSTRYDGLAVNGGVVDGVDAVPDDLVREARDAPVRQSPVAESEGAPIRRKEVPEYGIRVEPGDVPDRDGEPETGNVQVSRRLNSVRELLQVARGPKGHGRKAPQERQGQDQRLRCDDSRHDDDSLLLLLLLLWWWWCCAPRFVGSRAGCLLLLPLPPRLSAMNQVVFLHLIVSL